MVVNLLLLMAVSFLPFPTMLMAEAIDSSNAERAAVISYGASLLVISFLFNALWGSVSRDRHLLRPEVTEEEFNSIARAAAPNMGFYVGVIVLAIFVPRVAAVGFLVIAVVAVLRARGGTTQPTRQYRNHFRVESGIVGFTIEDAESKRTSDLAGWTRATGEDAIDRWLPTRGS